MDDTQCGGTETRRPLWEVSLLFLKLGFIAFGGPAAHIALMRREVVQRRHWISEEEFLDLLGASNLIPGPTSTEMAIFLGYTRGGPPALVLAGLLFILPAALIVLALAWMYVRFGSTPGVSWLLYGIKPVVIAIVAQALWGLGKTAIKGPLTAVLAAATAGLYLLGVNPLPLLLASGMVMLAARRVAGEALRTLLVLPTSWSGRATAAAVGSYSLGTLFLTFLKIGAVLYGSGYVLLAFLRADFVDQLHWLTDKQLVDAVAIGQVTPGPVFTTATFIGYVVGGYAGAAVATVAIFLPSFFFVAALYPLLPRVRRSRVMRAALDGINASALGLMAAVTWELARVAIVDVFTGIVTLASLGLLLRYRTGSAWLILGGGVLGIAVRAATG